MKADVKKSLDELRALWKPEKSCITCQQYESNYMTAHSMGHCKHDPAWTSRPQNGHCAKHELADNAEARVKWLEANRAGL